MTTLYILSKLITLFVVPVNYHYVPTHLIFNAIEIKYGFSIIIRLQDVPLIGMERG